MQVVETQDTQKQLWIYFLGIGDKFVKIGKSRQPRGSRLAQHSMPGLDGSAATVTQLCEVKASCDADEKALHRHFAHLKAPHREEVFNVHEELLNYIRWLRDEHYVSVPEDSDETRNALPLVDSDLWMPKPGREKSRDLHILPLGDVFNLGNRQVTVDDFYTNQAIIEAAREAMGGIDLDPASHALANKVVKAGKFFTISTNGLAQHWFGNVWVNPPFSMWAEWSCKIVNEVESGRVAQLCALAATRTITAKYFGKLLSRCDSLCIFRGRIPFWGGRAKGSPDDGHIVMYFGPNRSRFAERFSSLGVVFYPDSGVAVTVQDA